MGWTKLTARWIQDSVKSSGSSAIDFTSARVSFSIYRVSFLLAIYSLLNIHTISSSDSIQQQAFLLLPTSVWSPLLAVLSLLCPHLAFLFLDPNSWSWAESFGFVFSSSCPGNTSRLLRVPGQMRTGKNCGTKHTKYGQQSYPMSLPCLRATRRPTSQKISFDSFISPLSLKLH